MPMILLCPADNVPLNGALRVSRGRHPAIAVFNLDGRFHATADLCTHGHASLSKGDIDDGEVTCPLHMGAFAIATGAPVAAPCTVPLRTYRVEIIDGGVWIDPEG